MKTAVVEVEGLLGSLFGAGGEAGAGHAFAQAAFVQEILFQPSELLVEQVVGPVIRPDHHVGADGRVGVLDAFLEGLVIGAGGAVELRAGVGT